MRACAARPEVWITEPLVEAYTALHREGKAHSIEIWIDETDDDKTDNDDDTKLAPSATTDTPPKSANPATGNGATN